MTRQVRNRFFLACPSAQDSTARASPSAGQAPTSAITRSGIPSYVLLTHLLYQKTLDAAAAEARRAKNAGWFTFVMTDGTGRILKIEGSPAELAIEWAATAWCAPALPARRCNAASKAPIPIAAV